MTSVNSLDQVHFLMKSCDSIKVGRNSPDKEMMPIDWLLLTKMCCWKLQRAPNIQAENG